MTLGDKIAIGSLLLTVALWIIDKIFFATKRATKKYLLHKWQETKEKSFKLQTTIFSFAEKCHGWQSMAYPEQGITYWDYYCILKETWEQEYSDSKFKILKKKRLSRYQIQEYIDKLRVQEDAINLSQTSLNVMIKQFENKR